MVRSGANPASVARLPCLKTSLEKSDPSKKILFLPGEWKTKGTPSKKAKRELIPGKRTRALKCVAQENAEGQTPFRKEGLRMPEQIKQRPGGIAVARTPRRKKEEKKNAITPLPQPCQQKETALPCWLPTAPATPLLASHLSL